MSQPPALTTTFTPAPSCLSYLYALETSPDLSVVLGSPTDYSACFPLDGQPILRPTFPQVYFVHLDTSPLVLPF